MKAQRVVLYIIMGIITAPCTVGGCVMSVSGLFDFDLGVMILGAVLFGVGVLVLVAAVEKVVEKEEDRVVQRAANIAIIKESQSKESDDGEEDKQVR